MKVTGTGGAAAQWFKIVCVEGEPGINLSQCTAGPPLYCFYVDEFNVASKVQTLRDDPKFRVVRVDAVYQDN